jgi:hypothetical protein
MTSGYSGDTVRISGTKVTTTGSGISVENSTTNVLFDFGTDTLEFGTDYGDSYYGINIDRSNATNITVRGGTILHGVQNCGVNGVDTAYNCKGVRINGCNGLFLDSVNVIVGGFNGAVVAGTGYQSYRNLQVRGGHYRHDGCGYTSREWKSEVFRLVVPNTSITGDEYHLKAYGVHVDNAIHGVFVADGLQYIYGCTLTVDARNDLYRYSSNEVGKPNAVTVGPGGNFLHGTTQSYAFAGGPWGGSAWHDNLILTDSVYGGLDGGFLLGGVNAAYANEDTTLIYNNVVHGHRGLDSHYGYMNCKGWKSKGGNHRIRTYNNEFYLTVDTDSTELGGSNFRGDNALGVDWYAGVNGTVGQDSSVVFYNNYFEVRNVSGSGEVLAGGLRTRSDFGLAKGNEWYGNRIYSSGYVYSIGGFGSEARNFLMQSDTVGSIGTVNPDFWTIFCQYGTSPNHRYRDIYYDGISGSSIYWEPGGSTTSARIERTLQIYVEGNNDVQVAGAACSVWNNYGQLVISGTTNSCGLVSGVVSYWFESYAGDSIAFNDFRIKAVLGSDTVVNNSFTVGYTTESGLDTLTLLNTAGYDDGSDCQQQQVNLQPSTPNPHSPVIPDSITTTTPVLYVYNSNDPDGDPLTYSFQLYDEGQTNLLATTDGLLEGSVLTGWQVPDNVLVDSSIYSWRARSYDGTVHSSWSSWAQFGVVLLAAGTPDDTTAPAPIHLSIYTYPNPVSFNNGEVVTFTLPEYPVDLYITTVSGDVVLSRQGISGEFKWYGENSSGNTVAVGIYLWHIRDTNQSGKVMVKP